MCEHQKLDQEIVDKLARVVGRYKHLITPVHACHLLMWLALDLAKFTQPEAGQGVWLCEQLLQELILKEEESGAGTDKDRAAGCDEIRVKNAAREATAKGLQAFKE